MTAYSHRMLSDLEVSLHNLATQFFSRMPLILDPDEFIAAFIAPEHVEKLQDVRELVGHVGRDAITTNIAPRDGMGVPGWSITFGFRPPIILPQYVTHGLQPTCPDHIHEKIIAYIDERMRFGRAFGDALDALRELNSICEDAETITILMPCFPVIVGSISDDSEAKTTKRAQKLAQSKRVGKLPRLPRQVKDRLQEVSSIVNSVSLMRDAPIPETPKMHARFIYNEYDGSPRADGNIFDVHALPTNTRVGSFL